MKQETGVSTPVFRSAVRVALIAFVLTSLWCAWVWLQAGRDLTTFAWIGTYFAEDDPKGSIGYDGQFFYYIARDGEGSIPLLDGASFRLQRILYPLTARVLALGQAQFVAFTLLFINIVALSTTCGLLATISALAGLNPLWGIFYAFWYGVLVGVRFDLAEPLCYLLALSAVVALTYERYRIAFVLFILSVFTKEIGVVIAAGAALWMLQQKKWVWVILYGVVPAALLLGWWRLLFMALGDLPTMYPAASRISLIPFGGLSGIRSLLDAIFVVFWLLAPMACIAVLWVRQFLQTRRLSLSMAVWLASLGFVATLADVVWEDPLAIFRVATCVVLFGYCFICQHYPHLHRIFAVWWGSSVLLFFIMLQFLNQAM
jgi:hypothetical protein